MLLTEYELKEARNWISDCDWGDYLEPDDIADLSDSEVEQIVANNYAGGIEDFKHNSIPRYLGKPMKTQQSEATASQRIASGVRRLSFVQRCLLLQILIDFVGSVSENNEHYSIATSIDYLDPDSLLDQQLAVDLLLLPGEGASAFKGLMEHIFYSLMREFS